MGGLTAAWLLFLGSAGMGEDLLPGKGVPGDGGGKAMRNGFSQGRRGLPKRTAAVFWELRRGRWKTTNMIVGLYKHRAGERLFVGRSFGRSGAQERALEMDRDDHGQLRSQGGGKNSEERLFCGTNL